MDAFYDVGGWGGIYSRWQYLSIQMTDFNNLFSSVCIQYQYAKIWSNLFVLLMNLIVLLFFHFSINFFLERAHLICFNVRVEISNGIGVQKSLFLGLKCPTPCRMGLSGIAF